MNFWNRYSPIFQGNSSADFCNKNEAAKNHDFSHFSETEIFRTNTFRIRRINIVVTSLNKIHQRRFL